MTKVDSLCLIIPTYNRPKALLRLLDSLSKNVRYLEGVVIVINSSSDDGSDNYIQERISLLNKDLNIRFMSSKKAGLCAAVRESILLAPGNYIAVIADDFIVYPRNFPRIISELESLKPLFYRSYFTGYHSHRQSSFRQYVKPESILFAAQHLGIIYSAEAIKMLVAADALCFRSTHEDSKELAWVHQLHWLSSIISELLFLAHEKHPKRFISSGIPFVGFASDNCNSEVGKSSRFPYWHAGYFSEETWSIVTLICKLAEKYPSNYNQRLRSRLINAYVFDSVLKTFHFYVSSELYLKGGFFIKAKKLFKIFKYL